jgi:type IV secretory pathway VirB10-like protein
MRFGVTLIGALFLAGGIVLGQARPDLYTLERKIQDAQIALDNAQPTSADQREFRDLQDDVAYLRVKTRRGETVTDRERRETADRIDRFTNRITRNAESGSWNRPDPRGSTRDRDVSTGRYDRTIPAGTELDVRLQTRLYSDTAQVEDRVEATTAVDLYQGDDLLVPAGSMLVGQVTSVNRASRTDRKGSLTVEFNRLTVNGRTRDVRATVVQALESEGLKGEIGRVGAGAGVGAIIGGILGGVKGAIAGVLIGAGGVLVATEGKDVDLPVGTLLRVRFENAVSFTER